MGNQICILCRGSSMEKADKYFHGIDGDMIAVNEFNVELKHDFVHRLFDNKNYKDSKFYLNVCFSLQSDLKQHIMPQKPL